MKDLEGQTENHNSMSGQLSEVTRIQQNVTLNTSFSETNRVEVNRDVVRYEMDRWGNQTKILYPDTSVVTKTYDVLNRLQSVTDITGTTHYTYLTNERKVVETRPNGDGKITLTEWGKVTSLVSTRYDTMLEADVVVFEQSLNYDESGNVIHEVRKLNDEITTISNEYNKRGELTKSTQVNGSTTTVYTYLISPYGNKSEVIDIYQDDILHTTTKAYVYNHLNQLDSLTVGSVESEFEYDEYGNLILETNGSSTKTYSYDLNNRLIEAVEEGQTLKFTYDGNGNRLTKSIGSTVVQYVNDTTIENEQVLSYKVGNDVTNLSYGLTRLNEDAIGYLSDSYGNIVQHGIETYAYTPYGELTQGTINGVNEAGYKGEVHDTSSLQYLRARTYHTKLKQFLSEDTVVGKDTHPLSQNRYAFVLNNPFKYSDPSGHIALPYLMEDRGGPITNYKPTTPPKIVQTVQKKPAAVPPSIQKSIQIEQNYQKAEVIQNNKNVKNTKEAQKIAVITDYLNRTGSSTYENGIGSNPSKTTSTSNSTIIIGGTTVSTGNSSSYSYTNEKYLNESSNNQKPSILNSIWNGVKSIGSDIGLMVSQVPEMIKAGVEKFSKDPVGAVVDLIVSPIKQVVNEAKTILNGLGEIGEAIGYAMDGDWEAAGKSALSGVTNVIGGATSIAIVASTVLVAFNPVAAAVVAGYAMYGGIAESGLGLTQNIVGQMTNDSDYAKKGTMHLLSGAVKAFSAKGIQKLAYKKIAQKEASQLLRQEASQNTNVLENSNSNQYSTMYEAKAGSGISRSSHRYNANKEFYSQLASDSQFKNKMNDFFGYDVAEYMKSGKGVFKNPSNDWVWHHIVEEPGILRLIPKVQHQSSMLQSILHSGVNGSGGFGIYK